MTAIGPSTDARASPPVEILVVNPNTTASMTEKIRRAAETVAAPGTRIPP